MRAILSAVTALALLGGTTEAGAQHADIKIVASGGALAAIGGLGTPIRVQPGFCSGGVCLYSATDPGFVIEAPAPAPYSNVAAGTAIRIEIVSIAANTSLKVGSTVLDAAAESAPLGSAPNVHLHPSWQLTAPSGADVQRALTFRLTAQSGYQPSPAYEMLLSTFDPVTTTTTSTTTTFGDTSTTTVPLVPLCGDGEVDDTLGETCDHGDDNGKRGSACTENCAWTECGDTDHSGSITATDALHALRTAVGSASCALCVCDARSSPNITFSVADALILLRRAVGSEVDLQCPDCLQ